jgi:hypothetical protein
VSATDVGPIGFSSVYGLAKGDDGVMYGVTTSMQIITIDTSTGIGTLKSSYSGQSLGGAYGASFVAEAVPEPSEPALLCVAAVGFLALFRRRAA